VEYKGIGYKDQLILSVRYALATPEECRSLNSRFGDYGIQDWIYWLLAKDMNPLCYFRVHGDRKNPDGTVAVSQRGELPRRCAAPSL
jgi:hypothetical protein